MGVALRHAVFRCVVFTDVDGDALQNASRVKQALLWVSSPRPGAWEQEGF